MYAIFQAIHVIKSIRQIELEDRKLVNGQMRCDRKAPGAILETRVSNSYFNSSSTTLSSGIFGTFAPR